MPGVGLEPTHLTAQEPKSCVSASSTTRAMPRRVWIVPAGEHDVSQRRWRAGPRFHRIPGSIERHVRGTPVKTSNDNASHAEQRERLERDLEAFLAAGNEITVIPTGVSGQDPLQARKHLRLGPPKDRPKVEGPKVEGKAG